MTTTDAHAAATIRPSVRPYVLTVDAKQCINHINVVN